MFNAWKKDVYVGLDFCRRVFAGTVVHLDVQSLLSYCLCSGTCGNDTVRFTCAKGHVSFGLEMSMVISRKERADLKI